MNHRPIARVLLIALVFAWQSANAQQSVPKPAVKAGDTWTYQRFDKQKDKVPLYYTLTATFSDRGAIHGVYAYSGGRRETDADWTDEWNQVARSDGGVFTTDSGLFHFPFQVGKEYEVNYDLTLPRQGNFRVLHQRLVKVVGWEEVTVPAGRFKALRIQANGTYKRQDRSLIGEVTVSYWYVPQVKRWVKVTFQDRSTAGLHEDGAEELLTFRVQ